MICYLNQMSGRKAQSLSLSTLVIAAILLIFLVLILAVFVLGVNRGDDGLKQADVCGDKSSVPEAKGPLPDEGKCAPGQKKVYGNYKDEDGKKVFACCIKDP